MTSPLDRALATPGIALVEAKRVYGDGASVESAGRWASAGLDMGEREATNAEEITVWSDAPLETLIACLRGMPSKAA